METELQVPSLNNISQGFLSGVIDTLTTRYSNEYTANGTQIHILDTRLSDPSFDKTRLPNVAELEGRLVQMKKRQEDLINFGRIVKLFDDEFQKRWNAQQSMELPPFLAKEFIKIAKSSGQEAISNITTSEENPSLKTGDIIFQIPGGQLQLRYVFGIESAEEDETVPTEFPVQFFIEPIPLNKK